MQTNRFAFNIIGLIIAALAAIACLSTLFVVLPGSAPKHQAWWYFMAATEAFAALTLGAGALVNLVKGRQLATGPTTIMVLGYLATIWLFPLALWGIISLLLERKHRQKTSANAQSATPAGSPQSAPGPRTGVRAIALGIATLAIAFAAPQSLAGAGPAEATKTNVPPSIVFSPSLPDSWDLLETKQLNDGAGNSASRVIVRSKDRHWIVIVSTLGQVVPAADQEKFLKSWRSSLIEAMRRDYGTNIVEDGFSVEKINGRRLAQFRGRAKDSKANVTLFNRTWFEGETCIASQVYCDNQQSALENHDVTTLLDRITLNRQAKRGGS